MFSECHFIKAMITQFFSHLTKSVFLTVLKIPIMTLLILDRLYTGSATSIPTFLIQTQHPAFTSFHKEQFNNIRFFDGKATYAAFE